MTKKSEAKNMIEVAKGRLKEAAGSVVGNDHLAVNGQRDQLKAILKQAREKVNDVLKRR